MPTGLYVRYVYKKSRKWLSPAFLYKKMVCSHSVAEVQFAVFEAYHHGA